LLLTLLVLSVLGVIAIQVAARVNVDFQQGEMRTRERQCRRVLDSTLGIAMRLLTESTSDLRIDHLGEEWTRAKTFKIGDGQLDISIVDCDRFYDLKGLLVDGSEDSATLEANRTQFVAFASYCGLDQAVADKLADAIIAEADVRRQEDAIWAEQMAAIEAAETETAASTTTTPTSDGSSGSTSTQSTTVVSDEATRPVWLEDYLHLPGLTDEDRRAILAATFERENIETGEKTKVRFVDLLTIWRADKVNVNTASLEVLKFALPDMTDQDEGLNRLIEARDESPITNVSTIRTFADLDLDQSTEVLQKCQIKSTRFRVTATATMAQVKGLPNMRTGHLVLILERTGSNQFKVLWRSVNL
jgi:type II secretory pathway component PulK